MRNWLVKIILLIQYSRQSGRYVVNLPLTTSLSDNSLPKLNYNVTNTFKGLRQLEITSSKRPEFTQTYDDFINEYESLGHMSKIGQYPDDVLQNSYIFFTMVF